MISFDSGEPHPRGKNPRAPFHSTVRLWAGDERLKTQHVGHSYDFHQYYKRIVKERQWAKKEKKIKK
jgi:hypothetical protein